MTEWTLTDVEAPHLLRGEAKDEAGLSLRFEGEVAETAFSTLQRWTPPKWVKSYCLLLERASPSCSVALLTEGRSLSPVSGVRTAADLIARALKSLLTHCSQSGLLPTEVAVETNIEALGRIERVLEQFRPN
jgi:hypothetical protein